MTALLIPALDLAQRIGADVAAAHSDDVDARARFPRETMAALRAEGFLGALIPVEYGGLGLGLAETADVITELARHCSSSAMVFAMHQIQVACLVQHANTPALQGFMTRVATEQLLLASATSEVGIGGDTRSSSCAVEIDDDRFRVRKQAPVISYGDEADVVFATARRDADSPPADQVLLICQAPGLVLTETSGWDTMGLRGTCSLGYVLEAEGPISLVFQDPYADISARTMLPVSHLLWGALWLGMAQAAADRARIYVQSQSRRALGSTPPGALRLAELEVVLLQLSGSVTSLTNRYLGLFDHGGEIADEIELAVSMNALKVAASTLLVDIVSRAMLICGISGYRQDSAYSLSRLLRDAYGAVLMVNNDRILAGNAQLLLARRGR